jgi:hypothetical protein
VKWSSWASWSFDVETRFRPLNLISSGARLRLADLYALFIRQPM